MAGGADCLCLPVKRDKKEASPPSDPIQAAPESPTTAETAAAAAVAVTVVACPGYSPNRPGPFGRAMGVVLHSTPLRLVVLAVAAGIFAFCAAGIPNVKLGLAGGHIENKL